MVSKTTLIATCTLSPVQYASLNHEMALPNSVVQKLRTSTDRRIYAVFRSLEIVIALASFLEEERPPRPRYIRVPNYTTE